MHDKYLLLKLLKQDETKKIPHFIPLLATLMISRVNMVSHISKKELNSHGDKQ